jgi:hypothetical protein
LLRLWAGHYVYLQHGLNE